MANYKKEPPKTEGLKFKMTLKDGKSYELTAKDMPEMVDAGRKKCAELGMSFGGADVVGWEKV